MEASAWSVLQVYVALHRGTADRSSRVMIEARKKLLQAMSKAEIALTNDEVKYVMIQTATTKARRLRGRQKVLATVEFATGCTTSLV